MAVVRPILLALDSVNQRAPSGPPVMTFRPLFAVGTGNSVMVARPQGDVGSRLPLQV